ncbi:hypothetical protein [Fusibacter ferrireducens]|uniref:Uncharacterized protein n=1 Tax=Fusibacter ferrireducens TaxID=2785058 RepID=A0ABR9ZRC9_9FIRM|nr:hypothetical protein [Fusibacter ferrireducens]MBF4693007.1 hypothetical protein [Fusibacter ferrireducens]
MMSFVRSGPKVLIIEPENEMHFKQFIIKHFESKLLHETVLTFNDAISEMNQHQTLVYLADNAKENIQKFNREKCIIINEGAQNFLMFAINQNMASEIRQVRKASRIVIMQVISNMDSTIENVADDFDGVIEPIKESFNGHTQGTVICFTKANINQKVQFSDLYERAVFTEIHFSEVIKTLDNHSLKYINRNLDKQQWYDLTIKIYDSYEAYKLQYDRLIHVLDKLGAGIILREGWGEDAAKIFLIVGVYKVTLFTYLTPHEIKAILLALEYLENGERIVDYDLFYKKKKVHWDEIRIKGIKGKEALSLHYRKELYKKLEKKDIDKLLDLEEYIFVSR